MLFASPHLLYQLVGIVQEEEVHHPQTGKFLRSVPGIDAEFFHGGAPRWVVEEVMNDPRFHAAWSGLPDDQPREAMISCYDTDVQAEQYNWDAATKQLVEETLLRHKDNGVRYFHLEPPEVRMAEPWRGYDGTHHFQVVKVAKELDVESQRYALEYERAHKNRDSVVGDLEKLIGDEELIAA